MAPAFLGRRQWTNGITPSKRGSPNKIERHQVQVHRAYSSDVVYTFSDNYFDWMYIDGNHLHEFVKKDLQLYYPKVKPGGYLTGDDYGVEGWWQNGVKTAVDDFVTQYGLALEAIGTQFLVRKSPGAANQ
jgi:hypothetical protein